MKLTHFPFIKEFKKPTKYLIESVVIIEGSNKKKDNYAKWHSLWTSYTLKTPDIYKFD